MQNKSKSNHSFALPSDEDEKAINKGIESDPDTQELSDDEFSELRPVGRPKAEVIKDRISIRLSPEVTEYFRATGKGWQTKIDKALLEYISTHRL